MTSSQNAGRLAATRWGTAKPLQVSSGKMMNSGFFPERRNLNGSPKQQEMFFRNINLITGRNPSRCIIPRRRAVPCGRWGAAKPHKSAQGISLGRGRRFQSYGPQKWRPELLSADLTGIVFSSNLRSVKSFVEITIRRARETWEKLIRAREHLQISNRNNC